mmetsp:Transcript_25093/g.36895  ORF Transcript_25093/g.36895 Transcript_25093/m.36895 type:complete len:235 (+) Transcript_25093:1250-1954(+)
MAMKKMMVRPPRGVHVAHMSGVHLAHMTRAVHLAHMSQITLVPHNQEISPKARTPASLVRHCHMRHSLYHLAACPHHLPSLAECLECADRATGTKSSRGVPSTLHFCRRTRKQRQRRKCGAKQQYDDLRKDAPTRLLHHLHRLGLLPRVLQGLGGVGACVEGHASRQWSRRFGAGHALGIGARVAGRSARGCPACRGTPRLSFPECIVASLAPSCLAPAAFSEWCTLGGARAAS